MPLPPPPGYQPLRRLRIDRRTILLSSVLAALAATVLLLLLQRAARSPGQPLPEIPLLAGVLVAAGAASCAAWGETMRQLARINPESLRAPQQLGSPPLAEVIEAKPAEAGGRAD
jgi:hypothetical protein